MTGLNGCRVLVVEDELLVAMSLEDILKDAGCEVVGPVPSVEKAMEAASTQPIDAAVLDVNLSGERVYPVADALSEREIPFIFITGYAQRNMPRTYAERPALSKPFTSGKILALLQHVLERAPGRSESDRES